MAGKLSSGVLVLPGATDVMRLRPSGPSLTPGGASGRFKVPVIVFRPSGQGFRDGEPCQVYVVWEGPSLPRVGVERRDPTAKSWSPWLTFSDAATYLRSLDPALTDAGFSGLFGTFIPTVDGTDRPCETAAGHALCSRRALADGTCRKHSQASPFNGFDRQRVGG